jgi:hypothetical protein
VERKFKVKKWICTFGSMQNRFSAYIFNHRKQLLIVAVFIAALTLRFLLSLYNRQANDDHIEVINWIIDKHQIPEKEDCWECSQPKFYYHINAAVMRTFRIKGNEKRIITAQMINCFFGAITLIFVWLFVRNQNFSFRIRFFAFAIIALNPCLTGINSQATNDTLEILAGVASVYYADLFFRKWKLIHIIGLTISMIIASITKGSGLILLLGLLIVIAGQLIFQSVDKKKIILRNFSLFFIVYLLVVPFVGGYYSSYKKYGNPFINNISEKDPPPNLFTETYVGRPGITSIAHGYFTFRIFDMIKQPYITNEKDDYPLHRTSLWSQLYGRTFFMHYDQFPGSWSTLYPPVLRTGKVLLILGLIPLGFFMLGCARAIKDGVRKLLRKKNVSMENLSWAHAAFTISAFLFVAKYTYDYRDFATMKSIFIFPVLPSIIALFMIGFEKIRSRILIISTSIALSALLLFSIIDILFLINQLKSLR